MLSALCDEVTERADGKLDLIGIVSDLGAPGFPAMQDRIVAVFVMDWDGEEFGRQAFRADLLDEQDRKVLTIEGHTDVPETHAGVSARTRLILPLERVVFPHAGRYHFQLVAGGDVHRACSLRVSQQDE